MDSTVKTEQTMIGEAADDETVHLRLLQRLNEAGVSYRLVEHAAAATSREAAHIRGSELRQGAKALLLRSAGKYFLYVTSAATELATQKLRKELKLKSLSMASEKELWDLCKLKKGSVPPFGSVLVEGGIPTYCDESLFENNEIVFNCGLKTKSIFLAIQDYDKIEAPKRVSASEPAKE